ncbi:cupin domain-containing protein [Rhizobium sp. NPDC090279]|uniref:cupin domain-containing protein n=1 Tax=Rhizobium sp. NPDC090279 TaxID=3364499 RepID=UPI00383AD0AD
MDILSHLVDLSRLRPSLDLRCQLTGEFAIEHEPLERGAIPFHLILGGDCLVRTPEGADIRMRSGDFLLFPRGSGHTIIGSRGGTGGAPKLLTESRVLPLRVNGEGKPDVDLLCGHFAYAASSSTLLLDGLPDVFHVSLIQSQSEDALRVLMGLLSQETSSERQGCLTIMTALCLALFTMALRSYGSVALANSPGLVSLLADHRLARSVTAMVRTPARPWTLEELSELSAMSRATYARRFREAAGMTPGAFLTELRMSLASNLLLHSQRSTADVAIEVGYRSEAAFGKAFKVTKGQPPGRFRQQAT